MNTERKKLKDQGFEGFLTMGELMAGAKTKIPAQKSGICSFT